MAQLKKEKKKKDRKEKKKKQPVEYVRSLLSRVDF